jgi:hypothetical protein
MDKVNLFDVGTLLTQSIAVSTILAMLFWWVVF